MTWNERRKRRILISEAIREGASKQEVCERFQVSSTTVDIACRQYKKRPRPSLSHREARKRREEIAAAVKSGEPIGEIAHRYKTSVALVYSACAEFGIRLPRAGAKQLRPRTYSILRDLWDKQLKVSQIAAKHGVSEVFVNKIRQTAYQNGWPELQPKKGIIDEGAEQPSAAEELPNR